MGTSKQNITRFHEVGVIAVGDSYYVEHDKDINIAYRLQPANRNTNRWRNSTSRKCFEHS